MVSDIYNSAMKLVEGASDIQLYHGGGGGRFSDIYTTLPWWRGCPSEGGVAADTDHCV